MSDPTNAPALSTPKSAFDVVVIGSGAGGSTLAYQLAANGARVVLFEAGDWLRPKPPTPGEPVGAYIGDFYPDRSVPIEVVGGQTKFYGAALYRFRVSDFEVVEHDMGVTPGWPIRYDDLSPYYDIVEALYRVHGQPALDPTEPPRNRPLPHPPLPHAPVVSRMVERLQRVGAHPVPIPRSIFWQAGQGSCTLCATCDAHLCRIDAKGDADVAALRPALASGRVKLFTRTRALRVLLEPSGREVKGVEVEHDGVRSEIMCNRVVVCAGLEASVALLRRSRTESHPEGLGNAGGALGRYLAGHSTGMVFPFVSLRKQAEDHTKTFAINQFYHSGRDRQKPLGVIQMSGQMPMWREVSLPIKPVAHIVARHALTAFYMTEALPSRETGFRFDGDLLCDKQEAIHNMPSFRALRRESMRFFRRAGYPVLARRRRPYLWHETGGARMGNDPASWVVDANLEVHGIAGLHVADASVLPSAGAVNTGLTIMALAARLGDHLAGVSR